MFKLANNIGWNKNWKDAYFYEKGIIVSMFTVVLMILFLIFASIIWGLPASGKSTWAKQWVLEDPEHRVRINQDDIRLMLGKYWVPKRASCTTHTRRSSNWSLT